MPEGLLAGEPGDLESRRLTQTIPSVRVLRNTPSGVDSASTSRSVTASSWSSGDGPSVASAGAGRRGPACSRSRPIWPLGASPWDYRGRLAAILSGNSQVGRSGRSDQGGSEPGRPRPGRAARSPWPSPRPGGAAPGRGRPGRRACGAPARSGRRARPARRTSSRATGGMPAASSTTVGSRYALRTISSGVARCSAGSSANSACELGLHRGAAAATPASRRVPFGTRRRVAGVGAAPRVEDARRPTARPNRGARARPRRRWPRSTPPAAARPASSAPSADGVARHPSMTSPSMRVHGAAELFEVRDRARRAAPASR